MYRGPDVDDSVLLTFLEIEADLVERACGALDLPAHEDEGLAFDGIVLPHEGDDLLGHQITPVFLARL